MTYRYPRFTSTLAALRLAVITSLAPVATFAAEPINVTSVASIEIPDSKGKFDFLRIDEHRHRLLAAHENDGTADYIDLNANKLITRIKVGGAVDHAIDADSKYYYVSVQEDKRVAMVDAETLKEIKSINVAGPTDAIIFEPKNKMVYVTQDEGSDVFVIDPAKAAVVATIKVPGVPEYMVYDPSTDRIYLNIKNKDLVAVIDPVKNATIAQWATAPAKSPHGLALDGEKHLLYSAGGNGLLVAINTTTGAVSDSIDITSGVDQIAFDATANWLYCAGPDKMSVIRTGGAKLASLGYIKTAPTAKNVAVDPATHAVWTTYTDGKSSFATAWMAPKH